MRVRPETTYGHTYKKATGCGSLYVTVASAEPLSKEPIEVFARLGKAGGCSNSQNEALSRAVTLGLKHGIPASLFVEELRDIKCPCPNSFPKNERTLSCADAIGLALEAYIGENGSCPQEVRGSNKEQEMH